MNDEPQTVRASEDDPDAELTRLEWEASQRKLTSGEQTQLENLRKNAGQITHSLEDRIAPPDPGNPVINGDDSP